MGFLDFLDEIYEQILVSGPDNTLFLALRARHWKKKLRAGSDPVTIGKFTIFKNAKDIFLGHSYINNYSTVDATNGGEISIGNDVSIGPYVLIVAFDHVFSDPGETIRKQGTVGGKITIEDDVWIGSHVVITRDVTIGRGSVIGAGSIVTKTIPPYSVAFGSPARVVKNRKIGEKNNDGIPPGANPEPGGQT